MYQNYVHTFTIMENATESTLNISVFSSKEAQILLLIISAKILDSCVHPITRLMNNNVLLLVVPTFIH